MITPEFIFNAMALIILIVIVTIFVVDMRRTKQARARALEEIIMRRTVIRGRHICNEIKIKKRG